MIQRMLAIWSLIPLPFLKTILNIWKFSVPVLAWRILSISMLTREVSATVQQFEHSLALPFFWIGMKTDVFQSCSHCCVFQICWHIEYSTLTVLSFKILNKASAIPSPPLVLFVVMLPKAHLTLHPGCLALGEWSYHRGYLGCEDLFCTFFWVCLPLLLNIFCFC